MKIPGPGRGTMMTSDPIHPEIPRWLHGWAVLTVLVTLPLLFLGAEVTTKDFGMADPRGFRPPWELIQVLLAEAGLDVRIEYSHRLAGMIVGSCAIVLCLGLWLCDRRASARWLGTLALTLICLQGTLGIFRVELNAVLGRTLALVHGAFAQIVIATLVATAVVTSRGWLRDHSDPLLLPAALRRWSLVTALLVFAQLVLGGVLRHNIDLGLGLRGHLLGALAVVAAVLWLYKLYRDAGCPVGFRRTMHCLLALIGAQAVLGVETLVSRFFVARPDFAQHWIRSGHYVVGTFVFASAVVFALRANRRVALTVETAPARTLEGVA